MVVFVVLVQHFAEPAIVLQAVTTSPIVIRAGVLNGPTPRSVHSTFAALSMAFAVRHRTFAVAKKWKLRHAQEQVRLSALLGKFMTLIRVRPELRRDLLMNCSPRYYEGWSTTRSCQGMYPEGIPTSAYTHLNYAFAFIDPSSFNVAPMAPTDVALYKRFTGLKNSNPGLQTWISIGGWSMTDPDQPTHMTFSDLAASKDAQSKFFASLLSFLSTYGFDGVDLDWEYPVAPERSGKKIDYENYVSFLENLRAAFKSSGHQYGLTITIPSSYWYMQNFDIVSIAKIVDWFNVMTYDLHGTWDSTDTYIGSFMYAHTNLTEIDQTMSLLWRNSIDPDQVVMGLGFYGRSFTMENPGCSTAGCPFSSGGSPGPCTDSAGTLSFAEIEKIVATGAKVTLDEAAAVKQVVWNTNQWVSYDDSDTFKMKIDYANQKCLGGTMVWASSLDDTQGTAANALSGVTGRKALSMAAVKRTTDPISSCQWGDCDGSCDDGSSAAQSGNDGGGSASLNTGCKGKDLRSYCCPSNDLPTCTWRGSAPFCKGVCHDGEVEITSSTSGFAKSCWTGHKVLCCTSRASDEAVGKCHWEGSAPGCASPFAQAPCPAGRKALTYSTYGAGGEQQCNLGYKSLCCDQPPPYQNCKWQAHGGAYLFKPFICGGGCPSGQQVIAVDPSGCLSGVQSFCCDQQATTNNPTIQDFTNKLQAFAKDPSCPPSNRGYSKRELTTTVNNKRAALSKRDAKVEALLVPQLTGLFRNPTQNYESVLLESAYNQSFGVQYNLPVEDYQEFYGIWPNTDPNSLTESLLCMGKKANDYISGFQMGAAFSCENPCTGQTQKTKRQALWQPYFNLAHRPVSGLDRRVIEDQYDTTIFGNGVNADPSWGHLVGQIVAGNMQVLYERLILTNRGETILEVVWNLPIFNGVVDPDNQGDPRGGDPDIYAVFHFHVDHIWTTNGQQFPGIYAVVAFHGQYRINSGRNQGRVDGNDGVRNLRARVLECNTGAESNQHTYFWYPGLQPVDDVAGDMATLLSRFGSYMRRMGIITPNTFTDPSRGHLTLFPDEDPTCPAARSYFDWGDYTLSSPFMPERDNPPGPGPGPGGPSTGPADPDNDGTS